MSSENVLGRLIFYGALAIIICVIVFPYYWMFVTSMQVGSMYEYPPEIIPKKIDLSSYIDIFRERPLLTWLQNSFIVAIMTTIVCVMFSLLSGYSISRFKYRGRGVMSFVILVTQMLPAPLLLIPLYIIFRKVHLLNTLYGLIVADVAFSLPLSTWLLKGFFDGIPPDLEEAAMIDGCSRVEAMFRITFPLALPGIVATSIFAFLVAWDEFFVAFSLTNNPKTWVASVGLSTFIAEFAIDWNLIMASAVIFTIPAIVFFLFIQKHLIAGLTAGAVKG